MERGKPELLPEVMYRETITRMQMLYAAVM
jgi:hypothetical protein